MKQRLGRIQPLRNSRARYSPREGKVNSQRRMGSGAVWWHGRPAGEHAQDARATEKYETTEGPRKQAFSFPSHRATELLRHQHARQSFVVEITKIRTYRNWLIRGNSDGERNIRHPVKRRHGCGWQLPGQVSGSASRQSRRRHAAFARVIDRRCRPWNRGAGKVHTILIQDIDSHVRCRRAAIEDVKICSLSSARIRVMRRRT